MKATDIFLDHWTRFLTATYAIYGRSYMTRRIERAVANRAGNVFFMQIGSNDGRQGDPLRRPILKHPEWRGIFIEPVKFLFTKLKKNYGDNPRFKFLNVAIGNQPGTQKFYYVSPKAKEAMPDLPYWYDQLGSFYREHITKHLNGRLEPFIIEEEIQTKTLAEVLTENEVQSIDLLHIDTEGYDYKVLSQFDFKRYSPNLILIEHRHLSPQEDQSTKEIFRTHEYVVSRRGGDYLAVKMGL